MNQAQKNQQEIIDQFNKIQGWEDRYKKIIQLGKALPKMDEFKYHEKFLVKGCQSQVWLYAALDKDRNMIIEVDSDALIVKGLAALLQISYSNLQPQEVLKTPPKFIEELGFQDYLSPSRANGFLAMVKQIMLYAQAFVMTQKQND